jgi:hypothetical protein
MSALEMVLIVVLCLEGAFLAWCGYRWYQVRLAHGNDSLRVNTALSVVRINFSNGDDCPVDGNPDVITEWYKMARFTGKVWDINDFSSGRYDLNRGDHCKSGNDYYVFKDGGRNSEGPEKRPDQWTKIAIN